jgi:hypothetical protein
MVPYVRQRTVRPILLLLADTFEATHLPRINALRKLGTVKTA